MSLATARSSPSATSDSPGPPAAHYHHANEEALHVLASAGALRFDDRTVPLRGLGCWDGE